MKCVRFVGIALLIYLSAGAMLGGVTLIVDAYGNPFGFMPQSMLRFSPFHSYLIPGLILLVSNGLLGAWALWLLVMRKPLYGLWTALQGFVLLGWLVVECWMLRVIAWPHLLYGAIGLLLVVFGLLLNRRSMPEPAHG